MFKEETLPREEAIKALRERAVEVWDGAFDVRFKDGCLELIVEMDNTNEDTGLWSRFDGLRFMGHEMQILKVPTGYIGLLKESKK